MLAFYEAVSFQYVFFLSQQQLPCQYGEFNFQPSNYAIGQAHLTSVLFCSILCLGNKIKYVLLQKKKKIREDSRQVHLRNYSQDLVVSKALKTSRHTWNLLGKKLKLVSCSLENWLIHIFLIYFKMADKIWTESKVKSVDQYFVLYVFGIFVRL